MNQPTVTRLKPNRKRAHASQTQPSTRPNRLEHLVHRALVWKGLLGDSVQGIERLSVLQRAVRKPGDESLQRQRVSGRHILRIRDFHDDLLSLTYTQWTCTDVWQLIRSSFFFSYYLVFDVVDDERPDDRKLCLFLGWEPERVRWGCGGTGRARGGDGKPNSHSTAYQNRPVSRFRWDRRPVQHDRSHCHDWR